MFRTRGIKGRYQNDSIGGLSTASRLLLDGKTENLGYRRNSLELVELIKDAHEEIAKTKSKWQQPCRSSKSKKRYSHNVSPGCCIRAGKTLSRLGDLEGSKLFIPSNENVQLFPIGISESTQ